MKSYSVTDSKQMKEDNIKHAAIRTPEIRKASMRSAEVKDDGSVTIHTPAGDGMETVSHAGYGDDGKTASLSMHMKGSAQQFHTETPGRFDGTVSDGRITPGKAAGHLMTVLRHKKLVAQGCFQVGLYRQGLLHDLSKFHPVELINGFRYYQGGKQSPNNGERVVKGYSDAWMHHKGRNRHHFEYWTDYSPDAIKKGLNPGQRVRMPRRYVAEMLMDRIAASKTYMKENYTDASPLDYYEKGKAGKMIHPQTAMELERMLRILSLRGEKEFYRFVKYYYLRGGCMYKGKERL